MHKVDMVCHHDILYSNWSRITQENITVFTDNK